MENKVYVADLDRYDLDLAYKKLNDLLNGNDLLSFVKPKMNIAIKANLVAASKPESATTTHYILLMALCKLLIEKGACVVVGDSPGGFFNDATLKPIYHKAMISEVCSVGAKLNDNFNQQEVKVEGLKIVKNLDCCEYLLKADAIINFAKMKTHGMMGLSAATKNMFGSVPGTLKLEYHYRYPSHEDFANMLIDIQEYYKCKLHIVDAIDAMEGNGPTMGTPRHVGLLLASTNPYNIDIVCAKIMGLNHLDVPTIKQSIERNLACNSFDDIKLNMNIDSFFINDFNNIKTANNIKFFSEQQRGPFRKVISVIIAKIMMLKPKAKKKQCIGCRKCANICPAKAISMKNKKPCIDRSKCIRCFCCQEFCPVGAMKTSRTLIGRIITRKK